MTSAKISKIESMATLDGDGVRFAVFFYGCPLRCVYCHNPETWNLKSLESTKTFTPDELVKKAARYKSYFSSNGGVTFSGGEPLLHAEFINECAPLLKARGINYALDTSGALALTDDIMRTLSGAELIILDLKFYNGASYQKYTGGNYETVLAFGDFLREIKSRVWLRTVILPGINDDETALQKYAEIAKRWNAEKYELLAFHTMGFEKYDALNIPNPLAGVNALEATRLAELQKRMDEILK